MDVKYMRHCLKTRTKYHNSTKWHIKVDNMSDPQVMAVYFRILNNNEFIK